MENRELILRRLLWVFTGLFIFFSLCAVIYVLNLGHIREATNHFLYGKATEVTIEKTAGGDYLLTYPSGYERRVSEDHEKWGAAIQGMDLPEVREYLTSHPDVIVEESGTYTFFYHDDVVDVTRGLKGIGFTEVKIDDGLIPTYFMIELLRNERFAISTNHSGFDAR